MKSSRSRVVSRWWQSDSTLGVWRRSRPKTSRRSLHWSKSRSARVPERGVAREAGGHDELGARPQQLDPGLVADLDPTAGEEGDATAQVRRLGALGEVEVRARRAELVVEVVHQRELLLADVAVLRILQQPVLLDGPAVIEPVVPDEIVGREAFGREDVRRGEHRPRSQPADAGAREHVFVALQLFGPLPALARLDPAAALLDVRAEDVGGGVDESDALVLPHDLEPRRIGDDRLEQLGGTPHLRGEVLGVGHGRVLRTRGYASALAWPGSTR